MPSDSGDPQIDAHIRALFKRAIETISVPEGPSELLLERARAAHQAREPQATPLAPTGHPDKATDKSGPALGRLRRHRFALAASVAVLLTAVGTYYSAFRPVVAVLAVASVDGGGRMGPGPSERLTKLQVTLPARTAGYVTFAVRWDDGTFDVRPAEEQLWQRVETGAEPLPQTFPPVFTADAERAQTVFVVLTDEPATAGLHALTPVAEPGVETKTDPAFAEWLTENLGRHGVRVRGVGLHRLPPANP